MSTNRNLSLHKYLVIFSTEGRHFVALTSMEKNIENWSRILQKGKIQSNAIRFIFKHCHRPHKTILDIIDIYG